MGGAPAGRTGHRAGRAAAHGRAGQGRKREAGRVAGHWDTPMPGNARGGGLGHAAGCLQGRA